MKVIVTHLVKFVSHKKRCVEQVTWEWAARHERVRHLMNFVFTQEKVFEQVTWEWAAGHGG
jgi:hypothetical protein